MVPNLWNSLKTLQNSIPANASSCMLITLIKTKKIEVPKIQRDYAQGRLDRKTSGIILLAKKTEFVSKFQALFTNNEIEKITDLPKLERL